MLISEAMTIILNGHERKEVMKALDVSSPLISSWKNAPKTRIPIFPIATRIYGIYNIVVYPYSESDLRDSWLEFNSI